MSNWQQVIDQNFEVINQNFQEVLKTLATTDASFFVNYPKLYNQKDGSLKNRTLFEKSKSARIMLQVYDFLANNGLLNKAQMDYFAEKYKIWKKQQQELPKIFAEQIREQIRQQVPQTPQTPQTNSAFLNNSEMSNPFGEYAASYKANLGKGKSQERDEMRATADEIVSKMSQEDLKLLAKRYLVSGAKLIAPDPEARFDAGYKPDPLSVEGFNKIMSKPKNAWAKFIAEQPRDFKFNPNLLHEQYSGWYAAKNGLNAYQGDFNGDGAQDFLITDERDRVKYYNGYGLTPSKQKLYVDYNNEMGYKVSEKGVPFRDPEDEDYQTFREWYGAKSRNLRKANKLDSTNSSIKGGMVKYKPRYKTLAELIKDKLNVGEKGNKIIDQLYAAAADNNAETAKAMRKTCNITRLVSLVLKPVLLKIANGDAQLLNDSKVLSQYIQKEVQPVLNVQDEKWLTFKTQLCDYIYGGIAGYAKAILLSSYQGKTDESIMTAIYNEVPNDEGFQALQATYAYAKQAKDQMKNDWKAAHPKTTPLGKKIQPKGRIGGAIPTGAVNDLTMDEEEI